MLSVATALSLALTASLLQQVPQTAPQKADSAAADVVVEEAAAVADEITGLEVRPIVSVGSLYSTSRGFGVGGGFAASNLALRGDHLQVEGRLAQRVQGVFGAYMTGEPERAPVYATLGGSVITSSRFPFSGSGPHADPAGRLYLDRLQYEVQAAVAWQPAGVYGPLVQPFVRYRVDELRGSEEARAGLGALVSDADRRRIAALTGETRRGVVVGLGALSDSRDNEGRPSRGAFVQGSAERFFATDGSDLRFNRARLLGYLFRPSPVRLPLQAERGAVFVRVSALVTRPDGGAELPLVYLPVLERDDLVGWPVRSFMGRDALSVGVGARGVLIKNLMQFRFEGIALGLLGAGYDDVFREFTPRVTLSDAAIAPGARVPLQPSLGVGVNLHYRDRERPLVGGLIGIGPGGITATSFRLVFGLDRYRPEVR